MNEIVNALKRTKAENVVGYDRVSSEMLNDDGGCVASTWLFNIVMDKCLHGLKEYDGGLRMDEMSAMYLLYDDS
ncbi:hypothetical protein EVAR_69671_1 [Eumeta japonica]|uniref:Uncharacterized protein n=1 Tax=Eumeta variegata TaxID=151549 RepID=A0A4C1ZT33_EUMVA|nr:hypothetical protein EVAR_69671_1 [Eumeta japonica]